MGCAASGAKLMLMAVYRYELSAVALAVRPGRTPQTEPLQAQATDSCHSYLGPRPPRPYLVTLFGPWLHCCNVVRHCGHSPGTQCTTPGPTPPSVQDGHPSHRLPHSCLAPRLSRHATSLHRHSGHRYGIHCSSLIRNLSHLSVAGPLHALSVLDGHLGRGRLLTQQNTSTSSEYLFVALGLDLPYIPTGELGCQRIRIPLIRIFRMAFLCFSLKNK